MSELPEVTDEVLAEIVALAREAAADPSSCGMAHHEMHARLHPLTVLVLVEEVRVLREALLQLATALGIERLESCSYIATRAIEIARARLAAQEVDRAQA